VRTAIEALAAVLGGTQSLHTNSFDEALALPSEASARIARNTQLILREETGVTRVVDPLGGSYYVEALTDSLIREATILIDEVEALGGMTRAVENGLPKRRVEESAARRQARVDRTEETVVGVNRYRPEREELIDVLTVDNAAVRASQVARLAAVRASRDDRACREAIKAITAAAERNEPLMPLAITAARARATVGEISDALEAVYGRHRADTFVCGGIYGAGWGDESEFAELRRAVADFARAEGRRPRLLVAKIGQDGHDRGSKVVASAFADAGYDVDIGPLFATPEEVVRQAIENDVHAVGISTLAGGHMTLVPAVIDGLRAAGAAKMLVVVGGVVPPQDYAALAAAGVGAVFGPGTRIPEAARKVLELLTATR
jgi:methylmalonyl-CoA mutase